MMRNVRNVTSWLCGIEACSLVFGCGFEGASNANETVSRSSQAILSGTNLFFVSDVADCTGTQAAYGVRVRDRLKDSSRAILMTEGNNCNEGTDYPEPYLYYHDIYMFQYNRIRPVPGNHDYWLGDHAQAFKDYFGWANPDAPPDEAEVHAFGNRTYGEVVVGRPNSNWTIIGVNTNHPGLRGTAGHNDTLTDAEWTDELKFVDDTLKAASASGKKCALVYAHHPRFSSGQHRGDNSTQMRALWDKLYSYGVELVLSGHDHNYERFKAMRPDGTLDSNGIVQIVAGTGGVATRSLGTKSTNSATYGAAYQRNYGVVEITLNDSSVTTTFVDIDGGPYDANTINCH